MCKEHCPHCRMYRGINEITLLTRMPKSGDMKEREWHQCAGCGHTWRPTSARQHYTCQILA